MAIKLKQRPCTFGQSLWSTNCSVNFTFFWSTNLFFGRPKTNFSFFWSTKNQYLIFLVDQSFFWWTKNNFLMFLFDQFYYMITFYIWLLLMLSFKNFILKTPIISVVAITFCYNPLKTSYNPIKIGSALNMLLLLNWLLWFSCNFIPLIFLVHRSSIPTGRTFE